MNSAVDHSSAYAAVVSHTVLDYTLASGVLLLLAATVAEGPYVLVSCRTGVVACFCLGVFEALRLPPPP